MACEIVIIVSYVQVPKGSAYIFLLKLHMHTIILCSLSMVKVSCISCIFCSLVRVVDCTVAIVCMTSLKSSSSRVVLLRFRLRVCGRFAQIRRCGWCCVWFGCHPAGVGLTLISLRMALMFSLTWRNSSSPRMVHHSLACTDMLSSNGCKFMRTHLISWYLRMVASVSTMDE